ncbi:MAG: hypothetical protein DRI61_08255 [Chloroflexi bacterium]|nr:MAG: hypothetical protein DRI61_08255 [Chloroflexota bacterium]
MSEGRKKIDLEPKTMEEKKMREAFEQWYHSREFVPHGVMIMNLCYLGFKQGVEYMRQQIKSACEFYLKYKDRPALFSDEQFTIRWGYDRGTGTYIVDLGNEYTEYNEWLFKEAFKSVLEEKANE